MSTPEMLNREIKATKMARACFTAGITVDDLAVASAEDWAMLAQAANCKPPNSKDTVDRVLALLEKAYADAAADLEDKKADQQWEESQEYGANRCPPRE